LVRGVEIFLPDITPEEQLLLEVYGLQSDRLIRVDMPAFPVRVLVGDRANEVHEKLYTWEVGRNERSLPEDARTWSGKHWNLSLLSYFARRIFLIPELKDRQYELLDRSL